MLPRNPASRSGAFLAALTFLGATLSTAHAEQVVLKKGTDVHLVFDSPLNSKTAKPGDIVKFHVEKPVTIGGKTAIAEGAKVSGRVLKVNKRGRYGVNATVQLKMDSIRSAAGKYVMLSPKTRGQVVGGRTGEAAAATAGSALVLGPLGLAAGYFVVGKTVNAKPGSKTTVEVSKDTVLDLR